MQLEVMKMPVIKVKLDLPELENLLSGEQGIEISNSIIQEFTKRHLKNLVDAEIVKKEGNTLKDYVNARFNELFKPKTWITSIECLEPKITEALDNALELVVCEKVEQVVKDMLTEDPNWVINTVNRLVEQKVDQMVETILKEKINAALSALSK